jgi:hypothetical protein
MNTVFMDTGGWMACADRADPAYGGKEGSKPHSAPPSPCVEVPRHQLFQLPLHVADVAKALSRVLLQAALQESAHVAGRQTSRPWRSTRS